MKSTAFAAIALVVAGAAAVDMRAQPDPTSIERGGQLFRASCADCHGPDAKGLRGPDLTRMWANPGADTRAFQTIRSGVPGSIMPPSSMTDDEIGAIVNYLRSISTGSGADRNGGDAVNGERLFDANCIGCHRVSGRGGHVGPDLSRIGFERRDTVARSIRTPSAEIVPGYEAVTIVTRDGREIRGTRKAEDAFSVQIMDTQERLQGYVKNSVRRVSADARSLMPDFGTDRLDEARLNDLLAYLSTLRPDRPPTAAASNARRSGTTGVSYDDLLNGLKDPGQWLTYSGDYSGRRHSPLKQITPANADRLAAEWTFQTETTARGRGFEATPLLLDGVLYITGPNNYAWALDARTGKMFWRYRRELPGNLTYGASAPVNRGFGALGDRLFMVTLDAHLLALDRRSGEVEWDVTLDDYRLGYSATMAPLVIKDKVIVGISGGEYPTRGFLDAYDPRTGERIWRFYTVPGPGEPGSETWPPSSEVLARGGGGTWVTGSYDPELNTLYWGTGNPNPDYYGDDRKGENLYTASLVAIDADTGKLKWHYQFTPHDTHDWDSNHVPVLADVPIAGQQRKVVMVANRNGFFYALDRVTGQVIYGKPFTDTTWARQLDRDGRPIVLNDGSNGCLPDQWGGTNFMPPSFDPALRLFFVTARETCATYVPEKQPIVPGRVAAGGTLVRDNAKAYGALRAIDATTGERRWEFKYPTPSFAGVLSTAGGVVFSGDNDGNFMAVDSRTGKNVWHYQTGSAIWGGSPMTYLLDGRQFVIIGAGANITAFALPRQVGR